MTFVLWVLFSSAWLAAAVVGGVNAARAFMVLCDKDVPHRQACITAAFYMAWCMGAVSLMAIISWTSYQVLD